MLRNLKMYTPNNPCVITAQCNDYRNSRETSTDRAAIERAAHTLPFMCEPV